MLRMNIVLFGNGGCIFVLVVPNRFLAPNVARGSRRWPHLIDHGVKDDGVGTRCRHRWLPLLPFLVGFESLDAGHGRREHLPAGWNRVHHGNLEVCWFGSICFRVGSGGIRGYSIVVCARRLRRMFLRYFNSTVRCLRWNFWSCTWNIRNMYCAAATGEAFFWYSEMGILLLHLREGMDFEIDF